MYGTSQADWFIRLSDADARGCGKRPSVFHTTVWKNDGHLPQLRASVMSVSSLYLHSYKMMQQALQYLRRFIDKSS